MAKLPVLKRIDIEGYDLYPGIDGRGLHIDFKDGLTLILGTNGLGKTTLITLLYRMLTGPFDIPGLDNLDELGNLKLQVAQIDASKKRLFSSRSAVGAEGAAATLEFSVGDVNFSVRRSLVDLSLLGFSINQREMAISSDPKQEPELFHHHITEAAGLWAFSEWILMLRNLLFFFEDRRALVWDEDAQRQILRFLCLPPEQAKDIYLSHREIVSKDSEYRNQGYILRKQEKKIQKDLSRISDHDGLQTKLAAVEESLNQFMSAQNEAAEAMSRINEARVPIRTNLLKVEQDLDSKRRSYQRAKLDSIRTSFPTLDDSKKYIFATLFSSKKCLACGSEASKAASLLDESLSKGICPVCGSDHRADNVVIGNKMGAEEINRVEGEIHSFEKSFSAFSTDLSRLNKDFDVSKAKYEEARKKVSELSISKSALLRMLPESGDNSVHLKAELSSVRETLREMQEELAEKTKEFPAKVQALRESVVRRAAEIKERFNEYAKEFLLETCTLTWEETYWILGQTGEKVAFPTFYLDMTRSGQDTQYRREGPSSVSESQREFIELAFRMAIMKVFCGDFPITLIIDTPESSLDAVFVRRAANVLSRFSKEKTNRLLIASNLIDGELIPTLLKQAERETKPEIVNLMRLARPTAAVAQCSDEYEEYFRRLTGVEIANDSV